MPTVTLVDVPAADPASARPHSSRTIIVRLVTGLVAALAAVGLLAGFAAQWLAEREAVNDAATVGNVLAEAVVQPSLTDALADGDPSAVAAFDEIVRDRIVGELVVRVKLWSPEGTVLYADEPQLIGQRFELDEEQRTALENPQTRAEVSDLSQEENAFEPGSRLLEVYRPVWAPGGQQLLFEVYLPYEPVAARAGELWRGFAGVTVSSLLLLVALTAPIVWGMLSRLRGEETRRAALLQRAVEASEEERRRIAGTLHDGPVQELVATSFAAESAAGSAGQRGDRDAEQQFRDVAGAVRGNVRVLRSLLVDIYPAGLSAAGLTQALHDLAATARPRGVIVAVAVDPGMDELPDDRQRLVHRIAQETLRNTVAHAAPCRATVRLAREADDIVLEISDDGPGFDPSILREAPEAGHIGTRILTDLAREAGAELSVRAAPGRGTAWLLRFPLAAAEVVR